METKTSLRRKRSTASERQQILEAFRQSGLTRKEFARQNGLVLSTFQAWMGKKRRQEKPCFIAALNLFANAGAAPFRFNFPGGLSLEIQAGFRLEELASILKITQAA